MKKWRQPHREIASRSTRIEFERLGGEAFLDLKMGSSFEMW